MYSRHLYTSRCNTMCACCDRVPTSIASSYRRSGCRCRVGCRPKYTSQMTSSSSCSCDPMRIPSYRLTSPSRSGCILCARMCPTMCRLQQYRRTVDYDPKPHRLSASWYRRSGCKLPSRRPPRYTSAQTSRRNCHNYGLMQALCRCPYSHNASNSKNKIQP